MEKMKELNELKHKLIDAAKSAVDKGIESVDAEELGEVIDMIKDLSEAEKCCMEAAYYENVTEAMDEYGEGSMGYDGWRYSSGRFAPKGRGHRTRGYLPPATMMPMDGAPYDQVYDRMGYTDGRAMNGATRTNGTMNGRTSNGRMGFDDMAGMQPKEKLDKTIDMMGDIWAEADTETRGKMKTLIQDLLYQMEQN